MPRAGMVVETGRGEEGCQQLLATRGQLVADGPSITTSTEGGNG